MKLLYIFGCCVLVLYLGPVPGNAENLTPDDTVQITVTPPSTSPVGKCIAAGRIRTLNVRLWKFTTKSMSTFVRRLVSDDFLACFDGRKQELPAKDFLACSEDTDNAGLKMFKFMDGICIGYPFAITLEQQSCLGSGPNAVYTKLENQATARRRSETGRSPAFKEQATSRVLTISTDEIVEADGYKGIAGKGLTSSQTYRSLNVMSQCQCEYFCNSDSACKAYSLLNLGTDSFRCSLANANVYTNTPSSVSGSYYAIKAALVEPHDEIDNLIYKQLGTAAQGYAAQKVACEAVPGYRLVAVKFEAQMPILLKICLGRDPTSANEDCKNKSNWCYVDMIKLAGVNMIQGVLPSTETDVNSILVNQGASVDHFIYAHSRKLHDESASQWKSKPVCQANVYGVTW